MIRILALLFAGVLLLLSQCGKKERLYTEKQVVKELEETYGEAFAILRREELHETHLDGRYVREGVIYTMAPVENTDLTFETWDLVGVSTGSPVPEIVRDEYHVFWVYYVDEVLAGELEALCGAEGIQRVEEDSWLDLELSEEGWEEQLEALADFLETCNGRHPYDCALPMRRLLCLRVGPEGGNRWSGWIYDVDAEAYGLERERFLQNLGKDPDEEPPPPVPEALPPMEVHYGDQIILDGDEVIVVNRAEEPEEKTVPFDGRVEGEERFRGSAALDPG